jgi:hypothetical protein
VTEQELLQRLQWIDQRISQTHEESERRLQQLAAQLLQLEALLKTVLQRLP